MAFLNLVNQNYNYLKYFAELGTITKMSKNIQEKTITILKQKQPIFTDNYIPFSKRF